MLRHHSKIHLRGERSSKYRGFKLQFPFLFAAILLLFDSSSFHCNMRVQAAFLSPKTQKNLQKRPSLYRRYAALDDGENDLARKARQTPISTAALDDTSKKVNGHGSKERRHTRPTSSSSITSKAGTTLGDIMGTGLVTESSIASTFGITNPLDRMAVTANGNLQRLVSSYYDAPVSVLIDYCTLRPMNNTSTSTTTWPTWDRVVHLTVFNQTFCTATSVITVYDPLCQELVQSGQVGLGQLFRYLDILPEFVLHDAAPKPPGGFWRDYTLQCAELSCRIHEDFCPNMWNYNSNDR